MHPRFILFRGRWPIVALVLLAATTLLVVHPSTTSAHAELERSQPAQGADLGSGPSRSDLWFTEGLAPSGSAVKVYDEQRREVDKGDYTVDPKDSTHLSVSLNPLSDGTYTVAWTSISSDDGHVIGGTFTFSVGVSRLPGGAASINGHPSATAVALRWLVFLGLMIPAGWFLLGMFGIGLEISRRGIVLGGAMLALLADLALLPVSAIWPGGELPRQSLADAFSVMPQAWFVRLLIELVILAVVFAVFTRRRKDVWVIPAGMILTALAVFELGMTSHAAARTSERLPAVVSEIVHLEAVAFWIGGLALLALLPKGVRATLSRQIRRFSRAALVLAPLAVASGIVNAGITLPSLASLTQSSYGRILLVKVVFVAGILVFAWINRRVVRAGAARALRFAGTLRIELGFGAAAILVASILSLWTPPQPTSIVPLRFSRSVADDQLAHVVINPAREGPNRIEAWLTDAQMNPVPGVRMTIARASMLEREIDVPDRQLEAGTSDRFTGEVPLTVQGWWDLKLTFARGSGTPVSADFIFMVPDPVLTGGLHRRPNDPAAQAVFQSAMDKFETLTSMRAEQTLSDGIGNSVYTDNAYQAPNRFSYQTSSKSSSIAIGLNQWYRQGDQPWEQNRRSDVFQFPHTMTTYYNGATEFTMGRTQLLDGEECQVISFFVPEQPGQGAAWYTWWVGTQSHLLRQEAMAAEYHYMINHNVDFNSTSIAIAPPDTGTP